MDTLGEQLGTRVQKVQLDSPAITLMQSVSNNVFNTEFNTNTFKTHV